MQVQKNANIAKAQISNYKSIFDKEGEIISVQSFLDSIKNQKFADQINAIRSELDEKKQKKLKEKLEAAVLAGICESKTDEGVRLYSGFMGIDFDHLDDRLIEVKEQLKNDPYTYAVFASCRGKGLYVVVKVDPNRWADAFKALEHYYLHEYGLIIDASCKNISRSRFVSSDADLFQNEESILFKNYLKPSERKKLEKPVGPYVHTSSDIEFVFQQIEEREKDLTTTYDDWYRIGLALVSKFGEGGREYFHRVSKFHADYDPQKCDRVFEYLLRYGAREITIATFYHYAKQVGCTIMSDRTRNIVSVAKMHRKQGATQESTTSSIVQMLGTEPEETKSIVEQVFTAKGEIETDETLFQQAETFIKQQGLRFNEISRRFVNREGNVLDERGMNNLYIKCLNLFDGKLKRPDFDTHLNSDVVPTYNPLREFFSRHRDRNPTGAIQALANTISTDTRLGDGSEFDPNYTYYYLRKWLIGLVANIHGDKDVCSLMPVFTGKQGTGKTEWFRRLLPDELQTYYGETKFEAGKDDEILMTQKVILMNDELEGLTIQDARKLKALTSKQYFDLREPYGRSNVTLRRLAVLCGTSNPREVISDPTGNRRVIPINVTGIDHTAYNAIDKTDVLVEAYRALQAGERHTLNAEDVRRLQDSTDSFQQHSLERQLLVQHFAKPTGNGGEEIEFLSAVQIMVYLETRVNNRKLSDRKVSQELSALGFVSDQRRQKSERIRGFEVVRLVT